MSIDENALAERFTRKKKEFEIDRYYRALVKEEGSDLHLKVGRPPHIRMRGDLRPLNRGPIEDEEMTRLILPTLDERNRRILNDTGGADFSHQCDVDGTTWRFRVNVLQQMGHLGLVARRINNTIPQLEKLHLPTSLYDLCEYDQGMVLLAGVTGSGKSTTIASMLNYVNRKYPYHILTLEDPIEFLFKDEKSLINQREIGQDVSDFMIAMKHAVRQDPDVMLVGEMRDRETFETAIHAAETGHLVFGTIHASSASSTIGRILDLFPHGMHKALRSAMAFNMKGIVAQKLLPSSQELVEKDGTKRVPTVEILKFTGMISTLIMEEKDSKIDDVIRGGQEGMQNFTKSLTDLVNAKKIDRATAFEVAPNLEALKMALKGIAVKEPGIM